MLQMQAGETTWALRSWRNPNRDAPANPPEQISGTRLSKERSSWIHESSGWQRASMRVMVALDCIGRRGGRQTQEQTTSEKSKTTAGCQYRHPMHVAKRMTNLAERIVTIPELNSQQDRAHLA